MGNCFSHHKKKKEKEKECLSKINEAQVEPPPNIKHIDPSIDKSNNQQVVSNGDHENLLPINPIGPPFKPSKTIPKIQSPNQENSIQKNNFNSSLTSQAIINEIIELYKQKCQNPELLKRNFDNLKARIREEIKLKSYSMIDQNIDNIYSNKEIPQKIQKNLRILLKKINYCQETNFIPGTSEETLINLLKLSDETLDEKFLDSMFEILKKQLKEEETFTNPFLVMRQLDEIRSNFIRNNTDCIQKLEKILNDVQIFSMKRIEKVLYYANDAEGEINKIKGKDVVLFLGVTGSGKSTTILYLTGWVSAQKRFRVLLC